MKWMRMLFYNLFFVLSFWFAACTEKESLIEPEITMKDTVKVINIKKVDPNEVFKSYALMKEKYFSYNADSSIIATYFNPVTRYAHGILGDAIEAGSLVVNYKQKFLVIDLSNEYVFEDIAPRLYDVDKDQIPELICIRSKQGAGAGLVIYKIKYNALEEYANILEIGTSNRWLNIASIGDLNQDGNVDIAWVQTPHIGGILKIAEIKPGVIKSIDETTLFSNHAIGETNLCLSVVTKENGKFLLHLPSHDRTQIVTLSYDNKWNVISRTQAKVDFSKPLINQSNFTNVVDTKYNCIY